MRVLVCGGRKFTDYAALFRTLSDIDAERSITVIIEGGQRTRDEEGKIIGGADWWAKKWADLNSVKQIRIRADWEKYGRAAGPIRNQRMYEEARPDLVVSAPGGRGTADCVRRARAAGIEVVEVKAREPINVA